MKKTIIFLLLITLLPFFNSTTIKAFSENHDDYILRLDFIDKNKLPLNFRKTTDLSNLSNSNLDLIGLGNLNISGSSEFTNLSLDLLKNNLKIKTPLINN
ncbi:MAG: hypothetical protein E7214_07010 [Clostridium sp.]|nr:hypothetical protein [Clostridium sp.]